MRAQSNMTVTATTPATRASARNDPATAGERTVAKCFTNVCLYSP